LPNPQIERFHAYLLTWLILELLAVPQGGGAAVGGSQAVPGGGQANQTQV